MAMDVLNCDRRFVHENADRQRQSAERHDVQCVAHCAEQTERSEHAERNRNRHDQRAAPIAKKQKDECRCQRRGDQSFAHDAVQRGFNEERLIGKQINL